MAWVIRTWPKSDELAQVISPPALVLAKAPEKVWHGADKSQLLVSLPAWATQV
jgi:hypothetical protein